MKQWCGSLVVVLGLIGCVIAEPAVPTLPVVEMKGKTLTADTSVNDVLDALEQVGQGLKDFDANVSMSQSDQATGEDSQRTGRVWYQLAGDGNARVRVTFNKRIDGRKLRDEVIEYLLEGGWVTDRNYKDKVEVRRQIIKPGQKMYLLKLGEGPFPLPIGQRKDDVLTQFDVKKLPADKEDPAGSVHLELSPKKGTSFDRKFKVIDVWVDGRSHMPVRISTLDKNETSVRTTDLTDVKVNAGLKDGDFALPNIDRENWNRTSEPYAD